MEMSGKRIHNNYNKKKIREILFMLVLLIYPAINFAVFTVYLSLDSVLMAFQSIDKFTFEVSWVGFDNFVYLIKEFTGEGTEYALALKNNLIKYGIGILISYPLNFICGFWVYKKCFGSGTYRIITMLPSILSGFIVGLMFKQFAYNLPQIMKSVFSVENFPKLMTDPNWTFFTTVYYSFWGGVGTGIIYYSNAMNAINDELVESMLLEGCNWFQEFIYLTFPMIMPTFTTLFITGFSAILTDSGPLFLFWQYDAPRETYRLGYLMFQRTMKDGVTQYGIQTALKILITIIMFPLTMLVKNILDRLNPMKDD